MTIKILCILLLVFGATEGANESSKTLHGPTLVSKQKSYFSNNSPRTHWTHFGRYSNHNYQTHPSATSSDSTPNSIVNYPTTSKPSIVRVSSQQTEENSSLYPAYSYSQTSQEYWNPTSHNWNVSHVNTIPLSYSRPYSSYVGSSSGAIYKRPTDNLEEGPSVYQHQHLRPMATNLVSVKKYYPKNQILIKGMESLGKPKHKKTNSLLYHNPSAFKKTVYPTIHKPYVIHKHPAKKTIHPMYRRYYQSPLQQYLSTSSDGYRYKFKKPIGYPGHYKSSEQSTMLPSAFAERHHTTERMDESYPSGTDDYRTYSDGKNATEFYETGYEDIENTTSESEYSSLMETTTRGYYGDRIYMSTQLPPFNRNKTATKNKYFILRRTVPHDDDIETIFE